MSAYLLVFMTFHLCFVFIVVFVFFFFFFFSSRRRHTRLVSDWSSDVCSSDLQSPRLRAITDMVVRGAGAIGATAAYGFAQGLRAFRGKGLDQFEAQVERVYRDRKSVV